ncbi:cytochrome P450 [Tanacetum coccineum]|uniref:Cytochrome P450 n=1 Tax=Tanacetum coccineum TaxID=301880 RepID=A0ABQ5CHP5_9ASTR
MNTKHQPNNGLIVKLISLDCAPNTHNLLLDEGFEDFTIKYLGGLHLLVQFSDHVSAFNAMKSTTLSSRFKFISYWNLDFRIRDRITWLEISGIPPQLWSTGKVYILTSCVNFIQDTLLISVRSELIHVHVLETDGEIDTLLNGYALSSSYDDENSFLGDDDIERGDVGEINGDDGNQSDDEDKSGNDEGNYSDDVDETEGDPKLAKCNGCKVSEDFPVYHSEEGSTSTPEYEVNEKTPMSDEVHIMSLVKKPNRKSGGIVAIWDTLWFCLNSSLEGNGFLALLGDFNEVRFAHERIGSLFDGRGVSEFNNFISVMGLLDLPLGGKRFTRMNCDCSKLRKVDRILFTKHLVDI